ncbi:hypothetical protein P8452_15792 [Trifolium repens]|nr:hypothetical protein P8452_15792 [Trifolium repens]
MASSSVQTQKLPLAGGWSEAVLSKLPPVARGNKPKTGSTSSQQSVSLPVNEEKRGSKRASSSVADKLPKKLKKGIIDLTEIDEQNIDADLGRVIAKISGPNNESSNSCLQPPPNKMPVSTIPETLEEDHSQETPITEHASKGATLEEISTADSPPKGNPEENRQASPSIEANNQMKEDSPKGDNAADNEDASNQKSPSPEPENMDQYFESGNTAS